MCKLTQLSVLTAETHFHVISVCLEMFFCEILKHFVQTPSYEWSLYKNRLWTRSEPRTSFLTLTGFLPRPQLRGRAELMFDNEGPPATTRVGCGQSPLPRTVASSKARYLSNMPGKESFLQRKPGLQCGPLPSLSLAS